VTGSEHPAIEGILANLAAFSDATGDTTQAVAYRKRAAELHEKNMGFAFPANSPGPEALASVVPVRTGLRPFGNVHVGDWVVFSDGKNPVQRKEVIKKTPVVVIVSEQMRDPEKKEWMSTREGIVELSSNLSDLYDVDESQWKLVKVKIKDAEIVALSTDIKQEGGTCKVYLALDTIPVGGLAKMECGSQLLLQATDYGRGK
jgi:hypothetical protein